MPKRIGASIPEKDKGIVPSARPNNIPKRILATLGSLSVLTELPRNFSA